MLSGYVTLIGTSALDLMMQLLFCSFLLKCTHRRLKDNMREKLQLQEQVMQPDQGQTTQKNRPFFGFFFFFFPPLSVFITRDRQKVPKNTTKCF